jgi:hypothetical protein
MYVVNNLICYVFILKADRKFLSFVKSVIEIL